MVELDLRKSVIEVARWYTLVALDAGRPAFVNEDIVLRTLNDASIAITHHEMRRELEYLCDRKLIELQGKEGDVWEARLTSLGVDVVEYTVDCRPGIARPSKRR